jgi:hypothetical protein
MKMYFKLEFKKALFSIKTLLSIAVILALFIFPNLKEIMYPVPQLDGVDNFIRFYSLSYIGFYGPLVAGLLYSTSIIKDKESGFLEKLLEVISSKTYFSVKVIVNSLLTYIVFAVSYGIMMLYFIIRGGIGSKAVENIARGAFVGVYFNSKIGYIILILIVASISAAAFSTFILGVTTAVGKRSITFILTPFYVVVTGIIFQMWFINDKINFNVTQLFNLVMDYRTSGLWVILYDIVLTLLGGFILYKFAYKRSLANHGEVLSNS